MTREERELSIMYLKEVKEKYIEGEGYERHPLPEYYAIENAIKALEQESMLDKIRAEIAEPTNASSNRDYDEGWEDAVKRDLRIFDKYRAESEVQNANSD